MSTRVNLMKSGEFRRQGAVSGAFAVRISIFTTMGLALIFGSLAFFNYQIARQDLMAAREVWKTREPMYNAIQSMKHDLVELQKVEQELAGWASARVDWDARLLALQQIVPPGMQFRRLNIRGDHEFVKAKDQSITEAGGKPGRKYTIALEGKIISDNPVAVVNQFMDLLGRAEGFKGLLANVRLPEGLKQAMGQTDVPESLFVLEATSVRLEFQ